MKITNDKNLSIVSNFYNQGKEHQLNANIVGGQLGHELVMSGLIKENPEYWGVRLIDLLGQQTIGAVYRFLSNFLCRKKIPADVFEAFCNLRIFCYRYL